MVKQLGKKAMILLFAFFSLGITSLVATFDYVFVSPIHEGGHLLGCWALGIRVSKVGWTQIEFVPVSDLRQNVVGLMGGFSAALFLCLIYVLLGRVFKALSVRAANNTRLSETVLSFSVLVKAAVMADTIVQFSGGALEGTSLPTYHQIFGYAPFVFIITWAVSCLSLFWQLRNLAKLSIRT